MAVAGIKKMSAADEVFKVIHDRILNGELAPGVILPPQDQLARQLSVSRNTLREAIHKLAAMGLLKTKAGVGTIVEMGSPASYISSMKDHLLITSATAGEFFEARFFIEMATVQLAVMRASQADLDALTATIDRQENAFRKGDLETFSKHDTRFHVELANISGNKVLAKFLTTLWDLLLQFIAEVAMLPGASERAIRFHRQIVAIIAARDVGAAKVKMLEHLDDVAQAIQKTTGRNLGVQVLFDLEKKSSLKEGER
ncbi:MAG: FadR/GntR family transcriptional regulator [Deltaproteobacteria bacterium]|nr:FadR/GntR family transcriptional regulator [Deltaproteobacteria bacterium]